MLRLSLNTAEKRLFRFLPVTTTSTTKSNGLSVAVTRSSWKQPRQSASPVTPVLFRKALLHSTPVLSLPVKRRRRRRSKQGTALSTPSVGDTIDLLDDDMDSTNNEGSTEKNRAVAGIRHRAVTDPEAFALAAQKLMAKLHAALAPLQKYNDPFHLTRGVEEDMGEYILLDLGPVLGQYNIQVDLQQSVVLLQTPISGQVAYILSETTGEWCGDDDGHALEGLLVRDLIRQVQGVPNL